MRENATIAAAHKVMREAVEERGGLCACGAHSDNPCWRPATELRWPSAHPGQVSGYELR